MSFSAVRMKRFIGFIKSANNINISASIENQSTKPAEAEEAESGETVETTWSAEEEAELARLLREEEAETRGERDSETPRAR